VPYLKDFGAELLCWSARFKVIFKSVKGLPKVFSIKSFAKWYIDVVHTLCIDRRISRMILSNMNFEKFLLFIRDLVRLTRANPNVFGMTLISQIDYQNVDAFEDCIGSLLSSNLWGTSNERSSTNCNLPQLPRERAYHKQHRLRSLRKKQPYERSMFNNIPLQKMVANDELYPPTQPEGGGIVAEQNGLLDVIEKLSKSQFNKELFGFVSSVHFTTLLMLMSEKFDLSRAFDLIKNCYTTFINSANDVKTMKNLWTMFFHEVIPALLNQDPLLLTPSGIGEKLDIMNQALAAGKILDTEMMRDVSIRWYLPDRREIVQEEIFSVFYEVLKDMLRITATSMDNKKDSVIFKQMNTNLNILALSIQQQLKYGLKRVTPFCVGLWGLPGVGKTTMTDMIANTLHDILHISKITNEHGELVVPQAIPINDSQKFLDNISNNTEILLFDDFGTALPDTIAAGENAYTNFMKVQGSAVFPIPRSSIENKQSQFFNNKLTIVTSNQPDYGAKFMLRDMDAFHRRVHMNLNLRGSIDNPGQLEATIGYIDFEDRCVRKNIEVFGLTRILQFIEEKARVYVETRNQHMLRVRSHICRQCNRVNLLCNCVEAHVAEVPAPAFLLDAVAPFLTKEQRMGIIVAEELVYKQMYDQLIIFLMHFTILNYFLVSILSWLFISIFREYLETQRNILRFVCFTLITLFYEFCSISNGSYIFMIIPILLHLFFDLDVILEFDKTSPILMHQMHINMKEKWNTYIYRRIYNWYIRKCAWLFPEWFRMQVLAIRIHNDIKEAFCLENLAFVFPIAGFAAAFVYFMNRTMVGIDTRLGDVPDQEDIDETNILQNTVKGNYRGRVDGLSHSYPLEMENIVTRSNGTIPKAIKGNALSVWVTRNGAKHKGNGFVSQGRVYMNRHIIESDMKKFKELITTSEIVVKYTFKNEELAQTTNVQVYSFVLTDSQVIWHYAGDMISFPCNVHRRNVPMMGEYQLVLGDKLKVGDLVESCDALKVMGPFKSRDCNGVMHDEPDGAVMIDYNSKLGESGTPVFLVQRYGKPVNPEFVGILSSNIDGKAVFVTIKQPINIGVNTNATEHLHVIAKDFELESLSHYCEVNGKPIRDGLSKKSECKHLPDLTNIGILAGHVDRWSNSSPSNFYKTALYDRAVELIPETKNYEIPDFKAKVVDGVYSSHNLACIRQMSNIGKVMNESVFWSASEMVYNHVVINLGDDLHIWEPLSIDQVLKGTDLTNPLNRKSSLGFPFSGQKKDDIVTGSYDKPVLKAWYANRIRMIIERMDKGLPPLNISTTALKDEIVKKGKNSRVFFSGNTEFLLLCRMYLAPLMELFMAKRDKLFAKIGMNAIGKEFDDMLQNMYAHVLKHATPDELKLFKSIVSDRLWIDGDYSKYDKLLVTLRYAIHIILWLAARTKHFKQNVLDFARLYLILKALHEYVVIIGQDVFVFDDRIPSGVWATALINCICEIIIEVIQFYYLIQLHKNTHYVNFVYAYKHIDFFKNVALANYGDDNLKCVNPTYIGMYTHDMIMKFSEWICMPMTPSRKDENVIYAKKVTEILFLKRVPLYNDVLKRYVGVLDIGSIGKMLAFTDSYANDWERSVRDQARRELAFHGEELYYKYFKVLNEPVKPIDETLKEIDHLVWGKTNFDLVSEEAYRAVSGLVDNKFDIYPDCGKDVTDILRFKDQSGSSVAQQTCKKSFVRILLRNMHFLCKFLLQENLVN
jgi:hypothetical protein